MSKTSTTRSPRTLIGGIALSAAIVLAGQVTATEPATAHSSSYCGHGTSGILNFTKYIRAVSDVYSHSHEYWHYTINPYNGQRNTMHANQWTHCARH